MDSKLAKARSEANIAKIERRHCSGVDYKYARKAFSRSLRQFNKNVCRLSAQDNN